MTVSVRYDEAIARGEIENDPLQRQIIAAMDELAQVLSQPRRSLFSWRRTQAIKGIYLYGSVGVGKTFLMDLFFEEVKTRKKIRLHFHQFMQQVDAHLRRLQGQKDPLQVIAAHMAKTTRLLCFDEFLVHDVAHAMILAELLKALFAQGIVLVATSNIRPDDLYLNGVQRARFLPAIALIKSHCQVLALNQPRDYRLGRTLQVETFFYPLNDATRQQFSQQFTQMEPDAEEDGDITVQNRDISFIRCGKDAIWFDFKVICNLPRSQLDYLELVERFSTIFVSDMPQLRERDTVYAILFVHFIDVLYDRGVRLILSADAPLTALYLQGEMSEAFKRTLSRLEEMQSQDYLQRHPRRVVQAMLTPPDH